MDFAAVLGEWLTGALTLAKDVGKGGGGSDEEPTVCIVLLPIAAGVLWSLYYDLRRRFSRRSSPSASA